MAFFQGTPSAPAGAGDERSFAEVVRGPGRHHSNDDGAAMMLRAGNTSENVRARRANVRELRAQLAEEQQNNQRTQARLMTDVRDARAQVTCQSKELVQTRAKLVQEQHQRRDSDAARRRADVLLKGIRQELKNLRADHDRLQAIVADRNAARLLAGGINIQAACPTLPEIEAHVRRALTVTVSEWIDRVEEASEFRAAVPLYRVLSNLFQECEDLVGGIKHKHESFMNGGIERESVVSTMDEATADLLRQHVRRHHRTLFPLAGEHLHRACKEVISKLGRWLQPSLPPRYSVEVITQELMNSRLDRVVAEYLPILVGVTLLQHPAVVFSTDCGVEQPFDTTTHADSIDGDAVENGQACVVVFPALLVDREGSRGFERLNKPYILPVVVK